MTILRSVFVISFFISLSRILGFIRDVLIARFLGVSILSDVFFAAFRLPNFFRRIFAEGAFNSAFVPIFVEKLQVDKDLNKALLFVRNIFSFLFFILLALTILMQIFMPFLMKIMFPGFANDPEKFLLLVDLSRITIFYLLFISIVSLFSGVLNSIHKFAVPSSVPIILNLTLIASLFFFRSLVPNFAYSLSWGLFFAGIIQLLWVSFFLFKQKMLVYPTFPSFNREVKNFFKKLIPGVIGANVMQINLLVDTMIASLIPGAISYLYYADRINQLPLAMIGIAIGIALLPALSRRIKSGNEKSANKLQNIALEISLILSIPATLALVCLAHPIISVLFERGKFGPEESILVSKALLFYSLGLPAYITVKVLEPSFFSRGNTKTPMKIAIICLVNNVVLNLIFFKPFGYIGIVLASICSSYLNVTLLLTKLIKDNNFFFEKDFHKKIPQILIPAIFMTIVLLSLKNYFNQSDLLSPGLELAISITCGLIIYLITSYFSGALNLLRENLKPKANSKPEPSNLI